MFPCVHKKSTYQHVLKLFSHLELGASCRPWRRCRASLAISRRRASVRAALNRVQARPDMHAIASCQPLQLLKNKKPLHFVNKSHYLCVLQNVSILFQRHFSVSFIRASTSARRLAPLDDRHAADRSRQLQLSAADAAVGSALQCGRRRRGRAERDARECVRG